MYKIIIVDDDKIIRRGLSTSIDWKEHGFELCGSAAHGQECLELMEQSGIQIVITDIRMPFMDGFELTNTIKSKFPNVKVIMMTSYSDFEFAQKALKMKVFDYVLKPFDNETLISAVQRAANEIELEQSVHKKVMEGMPLLRQRFLWKLINGRLNEQDFNVENAFLDLNLKYEYYIVTAIKIDEYNERNRFGKEMLKYCIHNIAEEVMREVNHGIVSHGEDDELFIIHGLNENMYESESASFQIAETIRSHVEKFLKTSVTIGVGSINEGFKGISQSYSEACDALEFRHISGKNQVLTTRDDFAHEPIKAVSLKPLEKELIMKVKLGMKGDAIQLLDGLEQEVMDAKYISLQKIHFVALEVAFLLYREFDEWINESQLKQRFGLFTDYCQELQQLQTVKDIFGSLREFIGELIEVLTKQRNSHKKQLLQKAFQFIEDNYNKEGLSLQDVADHVHANASYLSTIFKTDGNILFSEFLMETRMKAAIELMSKKDLKTYEISNLVGFSNPQYFSICFKKYTGISPSNYKQDEKASN